MNKLLLAAAAFAVCAPAQTDAAAQAARHWREAHEHAIVSEFVDLLALPNLASDTAAIRRNADAIAALLGRHGVQARLLQVPGAPPVVYGEILRPGAARAGAREPPLKRVAASSDEATNLSMAILVETFEDTRSVSMNGRLTQERAEQHETIVGRELVQRTSIIVKPSSIPARVEHPFASLDILLFFRRVKLFNESRGKRKVVYLGV